MAWTAPSSYAVSEIVTAAKLNIQVRDNLNYLKGNAGAVLISDTLQASGLGIGVAPAPASYIAYIRGNLPVRIEQTASAIDYLDLNNTAGSNRWAIRIRDLAEGDFGIRDVTAGLYRMYMNAAGNVGFGTIAPQGKLHAVGAGGGLMFLSASAVTTTLVTIAAAGAVTTGAVFWIFDHNNTGGANLAVLPFPTIATSASTTYVNSDTITVAVTAGGAITVQRTATGNGGTHEINMLVIAR